MTNATTRPRPKPSVAALLPHPANDTAIGLPGAVRVLTCGSVDDGKSTLIGRLLWDATDLPDDQRAMVRRAAVAAGDATALDYSLLLDGLLAEREQGITIDIAWRTFDAGDTRFTLIDSPGHEQYTRNMASGASHADVAILLVDARAGIKSQTRRHLAILDTFGVRRVVLAVNKMDLVDRAEARFRAIEAEFKALQRRFAFTDTVAIPVSARFGDNVAARSATMTWYQGPSVLEHLSRPYAAAESGPFRMPVQMVLRGGQDFRGLAGTVTSGGIAVGDEIADCVSGQRAKVRRIATMDGDLARARQGQAVAIVLDRDLDLSRGAVLATPDAMPSRANAIEARLVWLAEHPFTIDTRYLLRTATDLVPISRLEITALLDLVSLERRPATGCAVNEIALVHRVRPAGGARSVSAGAGHRLVPDRRRGQRGDGCRRRRHERRGARGDGNDRARRSSSQGVHPDPVAAGRRRVRRSGWPPRTGSGVPPPRQRGRSALAIGRTSRDMRLLSISTARRGSRPGTC